MVNLKSLLDAATDKKSYEPDVEAILEYVEELKKLKGPRMRGALVDLRRKLLDGDQYAMCHCLELLDFIMKNCSSDVHEEILSAEFLAVVKTVVTDSRNDRAVNRALELMSEWRSAFGSDRNSGAIKDTCQDLDRMGYIMPQVTISAAAYMEKPPAWMEGQRCCQCRSEFKRFLGKGRHHCRNCGKSFCHNCSSRAIPLPRFGIEEPVRVCDMCYGQIKRGGGGGGGGGGSGGESHGTDSSGLPQEYLNSALAKETQMPSNSRQDELKEQEELELALALSLNDQENKKPKASASSSSSASRGGSSRPPASVSESTPPSQPVYSSIAYQQLPDQDESSSDAALSRYLDRGYWEQRRQQQQQEDTSTGPYHQQQLGVAPSPTTPQETGEGGNSSSNPMLSSIKNTLDLFVRRMQEVNASGRSIATDMSVQTMFQSLTAMHPQLLAEIESLKREEEKQQGVLQSLDEVKEARVSLDAMRRQHQDKMKQQQEELMMLARMQVEQKRALLQQLKAEDMAYQDLLRQRRQEEMTFQHTMLQQQLQQQREGEVHQRKAYEQQLLEQQFGGLSVQQPPSFSTPPASLQQQSFMQLPVSQFGGHSGPASLEQPPPQVLPTDPVYSAQALPTQQSYQMMPTVGGMMGVPPPTAAGLPQQQPMGLQQQQQQQPMSLLPSQDTQSMMAFQTQPQGGAASMFSTGYPQPPPQPAPVSLPTAGVYQGYSVPQSYSQHGVDMSTAPLSRLDRTPSVKSVELISFD